MKHVFFALSALFAFFFLDVPFAKLIASLSLDTTLIKSASKCAQSYIQATIWGVILVIALWKSKEHIAKVSFNTLSHLALGICITFILKVIVGRARPEIYLSSSTLFVPFAASNHFYSLPSSHAVSCFLGLAGFITLRPQSKPILIPLALFLAATRLLLQKHFISDLILGGWIAYWIHQKAYSLFLLKRLKEWIWREGFAKRLWGKKLG